MWKTKMTVSCESSYDCPKEQYCYDFSICVDFTQCIQFHRKEAAVPARNGSQCGPCLEGFHLDDSGPYCKTDSIPEIDPESNWDVIIIWYSVFVLILIISFILIYIYVKKRRTHTRSITSLNKRYSEIDEQKVVFHKENLFEPTAPSEGHDVHNQSVEGKEVHCQPFYNNERSIVNNKSQNAIPFESPSWVRNANLSDETNNNNAQRDTILRADRLSAARNDPDTNEQLAITMPEQTVEHEDNARNTALMQINDNADDTNSTIFNDDGNDNKNEENGTKFKTVVINQNITMNVSVTN